MIADGESIWKTELPLKIKILLLWRLANKKLQAAAFLEEKRMEGGCPLLLVWEGRNSEHTFSVV